MRTERGRLLTVVAPDSLRTWYHLFSPTQDRVLFVGEGDDHVDGLVDLIAAEAGDSPVRILSGHDSLRRDFEIGRRLRDRGIAANSQSQTAVSAGTDKMLLKQILEAHGVATPAWGSDAPDHLTAGRFIHKRRDSTQSRGIGWLTGTWTADDTTYWEEYVTGTEYSVIIYRESGVTSILPVVWKGPTRRDLLPPWKRLRLVPPPHGDVATLDRLMAIGLVVGNALNVWGFAEIEFVVDCEGRPFVLDVNPRICGTLRIAALAARVTVFDPDAFRGQRFRSADFAAEAPYSGNGFTTAHAIATSRLTCSAPLPDEVARRLERLASTRYEWPEGWR